MSSVDWIQTPRITHKTARHGVQSASVSCRAGVLTYHIFMDIAYVDFNAMIYCSAASLITYCRILPTDKTTRWLV